MAIVALDQGTTSSRTVIFDAHGIPISQQNRTYTQIFPQPGWVEHDPSEILMSCLLYTSMPPADRLRISRPSTTAEICPVSSETMNTTASEISDRPMPALCRVPSSCGRSCRLVSGKKQLAARMVSPSMIIAPSCSAVPVLKIVSISGAETRPLICVPVSMRCV